VVCIDSSYLDSGGGSNARSGGEIRMQDSYH
jgi:hypothetical protein